MFSSHLRHFAAGPSPLPAKANLPTGQSPARPITRPIICYVTDRKALSGDKSLPALLDLIRAAAAAGVDWVQIREKDLPVRELFTLVKEAVALASVRPGSIRPRSIKVIVNDRLDVALAAGAAGVHLGHASAPAREVVSWCRAGNAPTIFSSESPATAWRERRRRKTPAPATPTSGQSTKLHRRSLSASRTVSKS